METICRVIICTFNQSQLVIDDSFPFIFKKSDNTSVNVMGEGTQGKGRERASVCVGVSSLSTVA